MPSILFVCLGNNCRSPLAEAALREEARRRGLGLVIDSAGTGNRHAGEPPDARAVAVAARHGVDIPALRARQVTRADFSRFELIIALDPDNLKDRAASRPPTRPRNSACCSTTSPAARASRWPIPGSATRPALTRSGPKSRRRRAGWRTVSLPLPLGEGLSARERSDRIARKGEGSIPPIGSSRSFRPRSGLHRPPPIAPHPFGWRIAALYEPQALSR